MSISAVGSLYTSNAVSPTQAGNVMVAWIEGSDPLTFTQELDNVAGGGVGVWNSIGGIAQDGSGRWLGVNFNGQNGTCWGAWGVVTNPGPSNIVLTGRNLFHTAAQEFHSSTFTTWRQNGAGFLSNQGGPANYPSLTEISPDGLYVAFGCAVSGTMGGSSPGFTYVNSLGTGQASSGQMVYALDTSKPNAYAPNFTITPSPGNAALFDVLLGQGAVPLGQWIGMV